LNATSEKPFGYLRHFIGIEHCGICEGKTVDTLSDRLRPHLLSLLRIVAALIFIEHGTQKLFGFPAAPANGYPEFLSLFWWQGVIEVVGGALLLLGLFTRFVAFILSGNMAVAYWMVHAPKSVYPALNGGDAAILYCFVFLYIAASGGGPWSIDRLLKRS
jgi:putative oxidoreductase